MILQLSIQDLRYAFVQFDVLIMHLRMKIKMAKCVITWDFISWQLLRIIKLSAVVCAVINADSADKVRNWRHKRNSSVPWNQISQQHWEKRSLIAINAPDLLHLPKRTGIVIVWSFSSWFSWTPSWILEITQLIAWLLFSLYMQLYVDEYFMHIFCYEMILFIFYLVCTFIRIESTFITTRISCLHFVALRRQCCLKLYVD